jgi:hypothetical protein
VAVNSTNVELRIRIFAGGRAMMDDGKGKRGN